MSRKNLVVALALAWLVAPLPAAAADYHHVHITTASPLQAVGWYTRYLGCEALTDRTDAVDCYGTEVVFVCLLYTSPSPRD